MVKITCDVCGKVKPAQNKRIAPNGWILGYDLEVENANALQSLGQCQGFGIRGHPPVFPGMQR